MTYADAPYALRAYAHAMIHSAALWDVLGALRVLPPWWPPVSYVAAAAGIAAACLSALFQMLGRRALPAPTHRGPSASTEERVAPVALSSRGNLATSLLAIAILLGAWLLRGHAEIPPETPLVIAETAAAALYAVAAVRARRSRSPHPM